MSKIKHDIVKKQFWVICIIGLFYSCTSQVKTTKTTTESISSNSETFSFGLVERLNSKALNEERILNIYLPDGYSADSIETYPTIYILDGSHNEDFPHIAGLAQFMNMYELLPKSIVVGIANIDRKRDFTYPSNNKLDQTDFPTQGGSEKFINFIATEVQPFIQKNYKANDHETIIGQSLGGLLATEVLLNHADLFDDYVIVSPSLWWDDEKMISAIDSHLANGFSNNKRIVLLRGDEHPVMNKVADQLASAIEKRNDQKVDFNYIKLLDEDHATILHNAVYSAFEAIYPKETKPLE